MTSTPAVSPQSAMTTVDIPLNGRSYAVACSEAEAPRIQELVKILHTRVMNLQMQMDQSVSDAHLLTMVSLMLLDELTTAQDKATVMQDAAEKAWDIAGHAVPAEERELMVSAVRHLTGRVNSIAERLRAA